MRVGDLVRRAARHYADHPAVSCGGRTLTSAEVIHRATCLGNALLGSGRQLQDNIGVVVPNCLQSMEIEFGLAMAGLVRVSVNVRLPPADVAAALVSMEVRAIIYAGRYAEVVERVRQERPDLTLIRLTLDESDAGGGAVGIDYEDALEAASSRPFLPEINDESLYSLFCTSGTTGDPKGVMITHAAQLAVVGYLLLELGPHSSGRSILLPQPLSHGGGFFLLPYFLSGGHCVVVPSFHPTESFEVAERHGVQTLKLVPTMLFEMLKADVGPTPSYAPEQIIYGASPIARDPLVHAMERFGPVFSQIYGQAEAPMCITVLSEEDHVVEDDGPLLQSAGRPWRTIDVRVVDEDGREIEPGGRGEVIVRGGHMMRGYWREPELSARVLRDGYLHTRDLATVDDRGYVYLLGRMDEVINSGGVNIPALLVENVLLEHPSVVEAAVVGVPDPKWGEAVKAFVVLRDGDGTLADEIIEYCRPRLGIQRPRSVEPVSALPKNAYGKVMKADLGAQ
jgi:acyl-CoA synthetase (AMP-forming)/AMP-acid ligase II